MNKITKTARILFYACVGMVFLITGSAFADDGQSNTRFSISSETMEDGSATSVGITSGTDYFYGGLSLNYIESSEVIQHGNRKEIVPIYFFFGLRAPWKLSPYVEAGFDLPEAIIEDTLDHHNTEQDRVDYYYTGGLEYSANERYSVFLYAKRYNFIFRESSFSPLTKVRPSSYGIGLKVRF